MIVVVMFYDEVNMVVCQVVYLFFNVLIKVVCICVQFYLQGWWCNLFFCENMLIDVIIFFEIEVGEMVLCCLVLLGVVEMVCFVDDNVVVVGIMCEEDCLVVDMLLY